MKIRNNFAVFIVTSVVCLLPMIFSVAVYNDLPEQIAIHWNSVGEPDNFVPKAVAAFGLPVLFLAINIFSKMRLYNDPKRLNNSHSQAMHAFSEWVPPVLSVVMVPMTLYIAMGANIPISKVVSAILGVVLIFCGNYLPKCRQSYTIGIRLPWTLHNIDNWNKTHRLAGYLWTVVGVIIIASTFALDGSMMWISSILILVMAIVPVIYSYLLYKKG